ncbi:transposase, IS605 OrfB family [Acidimicrobium ferrooxidans DSM 10331]|uniref:Transposase, IS605 OrfB family n=1 Tax=Acidimicrobium ferrooxidans (strain DSM 10331 / JCM 15462 / NBRC 103882 / ICP) TaxID=525909 RepID=C7M043_ACIFD|nr:transposase, IS605 OrfB family [Acidimicrobium ferrooxidans DSM 10331]
MSKRLRAISPPFVVAPPTGVRVRTRLQVTDVDAAVLMALGTYLGSLASNDLAERCRQGELDAKGKTESRRERKRALTALTSSRWAGTITRTSEDAFQLAMGNLEAEQRSLRARIAQIRRRLAVPAGTRRGRSYGYPTQAERFQKQRRLQILEHRLEVVEARLESGRVSICRGGKHLANVHHHLDEAGLTDDAWRERWRAERWFLTADGEKDKYLGNLTIRWHPDEQWLDIALPRALAHLANRSRNRYRLSCPISFPYRGDEVAAQAVNGAVRYDIVFLPQKGRWYLDASWRYPDRQPLTIEQVREHRVMAVDLNAGHLATVLLDPSGNPVGRPATIPIVLDGLPATTRDGHLRQAISDVLTMAKTGGARAIVIENLDFAESRDIGRELHGNRPSRGKRGRRFRRLIAGIPTAKFRNLLIQMAANTGITVVAVDPAYTSRWGAEHWLGALQETFIDISGHHAAALVIGRRGLGQRARRKTRCDLTRAEHREERATRPVVGATGDGGPSLLSRQRMRGLGTREARGQPQTWQKTRRADRTTPVTQVAQDRSGPPTKRDRVSLSV